MAVLDRVAVDLSRLAPHDDKWWLGIPAIAAIEADGLDLDPRVTVVIGENGTGKSTFVEAIGNTWAWRLRDAIKHWGAQAADEDSTLQRALVLQAERPIPQGGCFLRAEAMHTLFAEVDASGYTRPYGGTLNTRSHGQSFLAYLESRLDQRGLYVLDEPEAALSFTSCLRLLAVFDAAVTAGSQVILATHSPVLAAFPGATILEFGEFGIRRCSWDELEMVQHWRAFLDDRQMYLRHLFD